MNKRIRIFLFCWASFTIATSGLTIYQPTYKFSSWVSPVHLLPLLANELFSSWNNSRKSKIEIVSRRIRHLRDTGRMQPAIPLGSMIVILAFYGVLYARTSFAFVSK
jgi:hypothetical protein